MTHSGDIAVRRADDTPGMREFMEFLREVCRLLLECGCSSNRIELLTHKLGLSWDFEVEALAIPTGVWITIRKNHLNMVDLSRVRSWSVDLDRLARINELVESIHNHNISIHDAIAKIGDIKKSPPVYGKLLTVFAGSGAGPVLVFTYGGSPTEIALSAPIGLIIQYLAKYFFIGENKRYMGDFVCAAMVALYSILCSQLFSNIDVPRLITGGIVSLVPGLVFVNAIHETAQKNLVSGAARLLESLMIAASLGTGVVFVIGIFVGLK